MMENIILKDPNIYPENNILELVLERNYENYQKFINKINEKNLLIEWNYYNDGKNWLCKILNKKKTICWLSIWNIGFKVTFYFTEKTINGIYELDINEKIKKMTTQINSVGKLLPMVITIDSEEKIKDVLKIVEYKINLK